MFATSASAEGLAGDSVNTGMSDRQCVREIDQIAKSERDNGGFKRIVKGEYSRMVLYRDGSVTLVCISDSVTISVYFSDAGNRRARDELISFLDLF